MAAVSDFYNIIVHQFILSHNVFKYLIKEGEETEFFNSDQKKNLITAIMKLEIDYAITIDLTQCELALLLFVVLLPTKNWAAMKEWNCTWYLRNSKTSTSA